MYKQPNIALPPPELLSPSAKSSNSDSGTGSNSLYDNRHKSLYDFQKFWLTGNPFGFKIYGYDFKYLKNQQPYNLLKYPQAIASIQEKLARALKDPNLHFNLATLNKIIGFYTIHYSIAKQHYPEINRLLLELLRKYAYFLFADNKFQHSLDKNTDYYRFLVTNLGYLNSFFALPQIQSDEMLKAQITDLKNNIAYKFDQIGIVYEDNEKYNDAAHAYSQAISLSSNEKYKLHFAFAAANSTQPNFAQAFDILISTYQSNPILVEDHYDNFLAIIKSIFAKNFTITSGPIAYFIKLADIISHFIQYHPEIKPALIANTGFQKATISIMQIYKALLCNITINSETVKPALEFLANQEFVTASSPLIAEIDELITQAKTLTRIRIELAKEKLKMHQYPDAINSLFNTLVFNPFEYLTIYLIAYCYYVYGSRKAEKDSNEIFIPHKLNLFINAAYYNFNHKWALYQYTPAARITINDDKITEVIQRYKDNLATYFNTFINLKTADNACEQLKNIISLTLESLYSEILTSDGFHLFFNYLKDKLNSINISGALNINMQAAAANLWRQIYIQNILLLQQPHEFIKNLLEQHNDLSNLSSKFTLNIVNINFEAEKDAALEKSFREIMSKILDEIPAYLSELDRKAANEHTDYFRNQEKLKLDLLNLYLQLAQSQYNAAYNSLSSILSHGNLLDNYLSNTELALVNKAIEIVNQNTAKILPFHSPKDYFSLLSKEEQAEYYLWLAKLYIGNKNYEAAHEQVKLGLTAKPDDFLLTFCKGHLEELTPIPLRNRSALFQPAPVNIGNKRTREQADLTSTSDEPPTSRKRLG